jgi:hypothetical protein
MDWRQILYGFLADLIAKVAPMLINIIVEWLGGQSDEQKVALVDGIRDELVKKHNDKA